MPTLLQRFARLLPYIRASRAGLVAAVIGALVTAATEPMIPALMNRLLDQGFTKGTLPLWMVPVAIIGLFALRSASGFVAQYGLAWTASRAVLSLRERMFERLLSSHAGLFGEHTASSLTNTLVYEAQGGVNTLVNSLLTLVRDTLTLLATTRDGAAFAETVVWNPFDMTHAPNARGLFLGDYFGLVSVGNEFVPLLALPSTDTSNRTDTYLLRVLPSAAARPQPLASGRVQALSAAEEREFRRRQAAFTQRVMERRVANWGARVGLRTPDAAPARR